MRLELEQGQATETALTLMELSRKAVRDPRGALSAVCGAARELGLGTSAAVVTWEGGKVRCVAHGALSPVEVKRLERALARGSAQRRLLSKAQEVRAYRHRLLPLLREGAVMGALAIEAPCSDVCTEALVVQLQRLTEDLLDRAHRARAELQVRRRMAELEEDAARVEALLTRAAHDLKAPLVPMKGYVDMLLRGMAGPLNPTMERYLGNLKASVERQRQLVEQCLSRERRGKGTDLAQTLRVEGARFLATASARGVQLSMNAPSDCLVPARRSTVRLLARTLLREACACSPQGAALRIELSPGAKGFQLSMHCDRDVRPWRRGLAVCEEVIRRLGGQLQLPAERDVFFEALLPSLDLSRAQIAGPMPERPRPATSAHELRA